MSKSAVTTIGDHLFLVSWKCRCLARELKYNSPSIGCGELKSIVCYYNESMNRTALRGNPSLRIIIALLFGHFICCLFALGASQFLKIEINLKPTMVRVFYDFTTFRRRMSCAWGMRAERMCDKLHLIVANDRYPRSSSLSLYLFIRYWRCCIRHHARR